MYKQSVHDIYCVFICVSDITLVLNTMYVISNNNVEKMNSQSQSANTAE